MATHSLQPEKATGDAPPHDHTDLSKFQLRALAVIGGADRPPKGVRVMNLLEDYYDRPVHHGRVYPNLATLVEAGLLAKQERDGRTNEYSLTDAGRRVLRRETDWFVDQAPEAGLDDEQLVTDGGAGMDYWARQLRAALDGMEPDTAVTERHNADDLVVVITDDGDSRAQRAELTHALERRGFTVVSETSEEYVRVDATAEPLEYPFADDAPDVRADGGQHQCVRCGHAYDREQHDECPRCTHDTLEPITDGGRDRCVECGAYLHDEPEPGTGVYCPRCGLGQHVTDGGRDLPQHLTPTGSIDGGTIYRCTRCGCEGARVVSHLDGCPAADGDEPVREIATDGGAARMDHVARARDLIAGAQNYLEELGGPDVVAAKQRLDAADGELVAAQERAGRGGDR